MRNFFNIGAVRNGVPFYKKVFSGILCVLFLSAAPFTVSADEPVDYEAEAEARKLLPVQTNEIEGWPKGPEIGAYAAILMDADTGTILYAKNIYDSGYPASTTKLLTALIAVEQSAMNEMVVMSHDAVFSVPGDGSNIAMDEREAIPMEQALYAVLVASANEVANAVGEHVAGSMDAFADMMNARAAELGCVNSHFVNTNGLPDDMHYTCAYDLALIARAFFSSELLSKMACTPYYTIYPSDTQPDEIPMSSHNRLIAGNRYGSRYVYEDLVGSKTGYTDSARQTLVSCAERNGIRLICVILKEESPYQFEDTIALFEYGFTNFQSVNVAQNETAYSIDSTDFFETSIDIFGSSEAILSLNQQDQVVIPNSIEFADLDCTLSYDTDSENTIAVLLYSYHGQPVGSATIDIALDRTAPFQFEETPFSFRDMPTMEEEVITSPSPIPTPAPEPETETEPEKQRVIFVNIKRVLAALVVGAVVTAVLLYLIAYVRRYYFSSRRRERKRRRGRSRAYRRINVDKPVRRDTIRLNFRRTRRKNSSSQWERKTPPSSEWKPKRRRSGRRHQKEHPGEFL
ncbi:MAG: D-alanyl-D-alanine carboxypeptidase [bacterium]|nr:D-alanyl-D-alanine carboxypeptidase [bacterium]